MTASLETATTTATISTSGPFQPFECSVCRKRFTRQENLRRHQALHARYQSHDESGSNSRPPTSYVCSYCDTTFSRLDLRRRHVKKKHPDDFDDWDDRTGDGRRGSSSRSKSHTSSIATAVSREEGMSSIEELSLSSSSTLQVNTAGEVPMSNPERDRQQTGGIFDMDLDFYQEPPKRSSYQPSINCLPKLPAQLPSQLQAAPSPPPSTSASTKQRCTSYDGRIWASTRQLAPAGSLQGNDSTTTGDALGLSAEMSDSSQNLGATQQLSCATAPTRLPTGMPTSAQISCGIRLFFAHASHFLPFIHRGTFDVSQAPSHLILSMLCLGFQYGADPEVCNEAENGPAESGFQLSERCYRHAKKLLSRCGDGRQVAGQSFKFSLPVVQAYLLLQLYAVMYTCGSESSEGLLMHAKSIQLCRSGGLMQPMQSCPESTSNLEHLWKDFVRGESHKRTILAVHQIDALWYQFLSLPRSISHLEIKHDMPCPQAWWQTSSASEWAHRALIANRSDSTLRYREVIQRLFADDIQQLDTTPIFDPYGTVNVIHFLLSSVREVSGWCTMTARPDFIRLEALRTSLDRLERFARPTGLPAHDAVLAVSIEATWEMAKIELLSWSPSHTGGVIENDFEGALATITSLATSRGFMFSPEAAHQVKPHIGWFLDYLEATKVSDLEPPWVTVYAFEAYSIAWQLMKYGFSGIMETVGVADGDIEGAKRWALKVFSRRKRWRLGALILDSLECLGEEEEGGEGLF